MSVLDRVTTPADIRGMSRDELRHLADDVRARLIDVCSRTGGHIGAGLGVVELTIALHYAFDTPRDQVVWDVGHQGYPHKLLTGRNARMETLRQEDGVSGFLKRSESEYDAFGAGHAATSISAALGMAVGRDVKGEDFKVAAVVGDGALTSGLAYEGLNNAGHSGRDIVVVLNDNEMSIAPNVGAMSKYLNSVQRNSLYNRVRSAIGDLVDHAPGPLSSMGTLVRKWEESVKTFLTPGVLFEELGFRYFGPIDGHDIGSMIDTLTAVRAMKGPRLVHVITQKGKGFPAGERSVEKWHALAAGSRSGDRCAAKAIDVEPRVHEAVRRRTRRAWRITRRTSSRSRPRCRAAPAPTRSRRRIPTRFFDVGIAEGHAVTFAAGLATRGVRPVVAIYSTFLQRAYDSIMHDVAIQSLPVIFCLDRAGLVGEDGETHMGLYDIAYLLAVPEMTVTAPKRRDGDARAYCGAAVHHSAGPFSIRYPRDAAPDVPAPTAVLDPVPYGTWDVPRRGDRRRHLRRRDDGATVARRGRVARRRRHQRDRRELPLSSSRTTK